MLTDQVLLAWHETISGLHAKGAKDAKEKTQNEGFRADLLVEDTVIVELKSVEKLAAVHSKQVLTQLRLSERRLGLLINFGEVHLKNGIERIVNGLPAETPPSLGHKLLSFFASLAPFA